MEREQGNSQRNRVTKTWRVSVREREKEREREREKV